MKRDFTHSKIYRVLYFEQLLLMGRAVNKQAAAIQFHVSEKSIQRDISILRLFFAEQPERLEIVYDCAQKSYYLCSTDQSPLRAQRWYSTW